MISFTNKKIPEIGYQLIKVGLGSFTAMGQYLRQRSFVQYFKISPKTLL